MASIKLTVYPGDLFTASIDPECLQVLTYLRLLGDNCPVQIISTCKHWMSPTGNFPSLVVNGTPFSGADAIIGQLKKQGLDCDQGKLDPKQLAEITAYSAFLTDRLKLALLYIHWVDGKNYTEVTRKWHSKMVTFPLTLYILSRQHRLVQQVMKTGLPEHITPEQRGIQLINQAEEALDLLSDRLHNETFFSGTSPSSLDALVYGYLELIAQYQLPGNNQLQLKLNSLRNLSEYCDNIRRLLFPEMKTRPATTMTITRSSPLYKDPTLWACVAIAGVLLTIQGMRVGLLGRLVNNLNKNRWVEFMSSITEEEQLDELNGLE